MAAVAGLTRSVPIGAALVCLAVSFGVATAQVRFEPYTLARGESIDWAGAVRLRLEGRETSVAIVQTGRELALIRESRGTVSVTARLQLPADAWVWDSVADLDGVSGGIVAIGAQHVRRMSWAPAAGAVPPSPRPAGDLFRGEPRGAPVRVPIVDPSRSPGVVLVPSLERVDVVRLNGEAPVLATLSAAAASEQTLGWGLGYRMVSRLSVADLRFADADGDGVSDLIWRQEDRFIARLAVRDSYAEAKPWGAAPHIVQRTILGFEHDIGALVRDHDGDGRSDLIAVEPGSGTVFVYRGGTRHEGTEAAPDQIIKCAGWVLWRYLHDVDGDGKDDLILLVVPELNLLEQLGVFRKSALPVRLTVQPQLADGTFARSPTQQTKFSLPTLVSLTRNKRTVHFKSPLAVLGLESGAAGLLAPDDDGRTVLWRFRRDGLERWGTTPERDATGTFLTAPFEPAGLDLNGDGIVDPILQSKNPDAAGETAVLWMSVIDR